MNRMVTSVRTSCNPRFSLDALTLVTMEHTLGARIRRALDALTARSGAKKTPNWLAGQVGVSRNAAYKWMNNPNAGIDGENLYKAAKALQVSSDWLASGKGEMEPDANNGNYVVAETMEDLVRQVKARGHDEVLELIKLLADNKDEIFNKKSD